MTPRDLAAAVSAGVLTVIAFVLLELAAYWWHDAFLSFTERSGELLVVDPRAALAVAMGAFALGWITWLGGRRPAAGFTSGAVVLLFWLTTWFTAGPVDAWRTFIAQVTTEHVATVLPLLGFVLAPSLAATIVIPAALTQLGIRSTGVRPLRLALAALSALVASAAVVGAILLLDHAYRWHEDYLSTGWLPGDVPTLALVGMLSTLAATALVAAVTFSTRWSAAGAASAAVVVLTLWVVLCIWVWPFSTAVVTGAFEGDPFLYAGFGWSATTLGLLGLPLLGGALAGAALSQRNSASTLAAELAAVPAGGPSEGGAAAV